VTSGAHAALPPVQPDNFDEPQPPLEATHGWRSGVAPARVSPLTGWSVARFGSNSKRMLSLALFVATRTHLWLIRRS
jgi:hypothetical protein